MQCLSFFAPTHDESIGALVVARLVSARRLTPRGHRMAATRSLAFPTAVRVINRVHRDAAVVRTESFPADPSRLTDGDVLVIGVAHLPDRRHTILQHLTGLSRGQL